MGYSVRGGDAVLVPSRGQMTKVMERLGLRHDHLVSGAERPSPTGELLVAYFEHRARALNDTARHLLMDADEARLAFEAVVAEHDPPGSAAPEEQAERSKGETRLPHRDREHARLGGSKSRDLRCGPAGAHDLHTRGRPVADDGPKRVDGAFPSAVNPVAVWEIKEHYHTTTFGSRVSGAVYETLLDGLELDELREEEGVEVKHYLFLDARYTWWNCGRSYLCRMIDMLHMGLVDEVLFGREVVDRIPQLVAEWLEAVERLPTKEP